MILCCIIKRFNKKPSQNVAILADFTTSCLILTDSKSLTLLGANKLRYFFSIQKAPELFVTNLFLDNEATIFVWCHNNGVWASTQIFNGVYSHPLLSLSAHTYLCFPTCRTFYVKCSPAVVLRSHCTFSWFLMTCKAFCSKVGVKLSDGVAKMVNTARK